MAPTNDELHCYACNAAVSEREALDGWCDTCGKRLPASFADLVRRREKTAPAPVSVDIPDSHPAPLKRRLLFGGVAVGILGVVALLLALAGGG
jgi:hypothetical protein